ncbi:MAG: NAD(+)/NADH kinase [Anaerolineae bacterium]
MTSIGIIANPAAGKDVRRIVAHGFSVDNEQKVSIVRRVILGAVAMGCRHVLIMPDSYGIGWRAVDGLPKNVPGRECCELVEAPVSHTAADSLVAAAMMAERGVGCLVTLGGDGTVRLAAKATATTPLLPLSTGTNNVLPTFVEATLAGMAAALVAGSADIRGECVRPRSGLVLHAPGVEDMALVDVATLRGSAVGARAVWDWRAIGAVVAVAPRADSIGLSAIVGSRFPHRPAAAWVAVGEGPAVLAAIAPGIVAQVPIAAGGVLADGQVLPLGQGPMVVAFDGEREMVVRSGDVSVEVRPACAAIVDVSAVLTRAATEGLLSAKG